MKVDLLVEPGVGITPVRIGMTRQEVETLGVDLADDTFRVSFDDEDGCKEIEVPVFNNDRPVLLGGRDLNNISIHDTQEIFLATLGSNRTGPKP